MEGNVILVNGKELIYTEKESEKIQTNINKAENIDNNAQTEIDLNTIKKNASEFGSIENFELNTFFDDGENENYLTKSRKERYDIYRKMDENEFIHRGLEIISDDASQKNEHGNVITVYSDDEKKKTVLEKLFLEKMDLNNELWSIVYQTIKLGDDFYEIIPDNYKKPKEISKIRFLNPDKTERIEINNKLAYFKYKAEKKDKVGKKTEENIYKLWPWQIAHFKLDDKELLPYGVSVLSPGIRTYKRMSLLEDILLVYKISRAPERRIFYVDVGNLTPNEAKQFLQKMKNHYRGQSIIDENGNLNRKSNLLSITSDIFIPVREGTQGTRIETLQGSTTMAGGGSEDPLLKHFKEKILKTMNIPAAYLGEQADRSRALSQLDQRFGRFVERIQSQIIRTLNKIAAIELFFNGYKKEDLKDFSIEITSPSNIKELTDLDIINQKMNLIATIQSLDLLPKQWIFKNILRFSDKEISDIEFQRTMEKQASAAAESGAAAAEMGSFDMPGAEPGGAEAEPESSAEESEEISKEEMITDSIVKVMGKEFLMENRESIIRLFSLLEKEKNKEEKSSLLIEELTDFINNADNKKKPRKQNSVYKLIAENEFDGIEFEDKQIKLWKKSETLAEEIISVSVNS